MNWLILRSATGSPRLTRRTTMATSSLAPGTEAIGTSDSSIEKATRQVPGKRRAGWIGLGFVVPALALIGWEAASRLGWLDKSIASSPGEILVEIDRLVTTGQIWVHLWATFVRVFNGFALGAVVAIVLGALTGISPIIYRLLNPTIHAI